MEQAAAGASDPWDRIRRRGYAYLQWGMENPEHYRILMMSRADLTPERFVDERMADTAGLDAVAADLAAAVAAGTIEDSGDPVKTTELLWMVMHGLVSLLIAKPEFPFGNPDEVFDRMLELVHKGLAPRT
jgi:AcrR family transcriptional regulator